MTITTLVNGKYSDSVSVEDRGLAYGDGLFETIELLGSLPRFLDYHLERLQQGCQRLNIDCDFKLLRQEIESILSVALAGRSVMKIIVTRGSSGRGYFGDDQAPANRMISIQPLLLDYSRQQSEGVRLRVCDHRLPINPPLAGLKHLSRLDNVIARSEWKDDKITEGLMLDMDGRLVEGTMSNVFVVSQKKIFTPRLDRCGVDGVMRQVIIKKIIPVLAMECSVKDLSLTELFQADEIFICNSLMGVVPVVAVDCHQKTIGPVTRDIQHALVGEV